MKLEAFRQAPGRSLGKAAAAVAAIAHEHAKPGAPYCQSQLALLLSNHGIDANPLESLLATTSMACDELVATLGWWRHPAYPFFAKSVDKTTLPLILQYAVPPGFGQNAQALTHIAELFTGETPTPGTVRRTLSRMVEQGLYQRVGEGLYANCYKGD